MDLMKITAAPWMQTRFPSRKRCVMAPTDPMGKMGKMVTVAQSDQLVLLENKAHRENLAKKGHVAPLDYAVQPALRALPAQPALPALPALPARQELTGKI